MPAWSRGPGSSHPRGWAPSGLCPGLWDPVHPPGLQPHPELFLQCVPPTCLSAFEPAQPSAGKALPCQGPTSRASKIPPRSPTPDGLRVSVEDQGSWMRWGHSDRQLGRKAGVVLVCPQEVGLCCLRTPCPGTLGECGQDIRLQPLALACGRRRLRPCTRAQGGVSFTLCSQVRALGPGLRPEVCPALPATTRDTMSQSGSVSCFPGAAK